MRMIDRWFPCEAVSEASYQPYGSGMTEKKLFTWFAARPIAQARAAALTTLLPWPEDVVEQRRLQRIVIRAVMNEPNGLRDAAEEVRSHYPDSVRVLDPFAGRGIIPLEVTRAGAESWGIDYSPLAALAGMLLADFPFRNWSAEPRLFFQGQGDDPKQEALLGTDRLITDLRVVLDLIGKRHSNYSA